MTMQSLNAENDKFSDYGITEWSSDEEVISFIRKVRNKISSSSISDNEDIYESEDLEKILEKLAIEEEEKLKILKNGLLMELLFDVTSDEVLSLFFNQKVISLLIPETYKYADQKSPQHPNWKEKMETHYFQSNEHIYWAVDLNGPSINAATKCWSMDLIYTNRQLLQNIIPSQLLQNIALFLNVVEKETTYI
ncbi:piggyBac transposable element-derived protein 4-like isoform X1 [Vespula squamosa]|uniref:PiggyBac transposable element-derived protein 4-like isoform X1 n=1 Tax=Vespula squamosa TaxID=30214 RepID=A0ABD2BHC2_VESSQ